MDSSQGSTLSANMAGLVDSSPTRREVCYIDTMPGYVKELIAGGAAGGIAKTAVAPLERTKILLQTRTEGFQSLGVFQSLKKLFKHEGILGFYKGNGASVIRIVPYAALHFMTYEQYRGWILDNCPVLGSGPVIDLLAGSVAGGTAVLFTYPLDLARTKLAYQVLNKNGNFSCGLKSGNFRYSLKSISAQPAYGGLKDVLAGVYKAGGMRALYRGVGGCILKCICLHCGLHCGLGKFIAGVDYWSGCPVRARARKFAATQEGLIQLSCARMDQRPNFFFVSTLT